MERSRRHPLKRQGGSAGSASNTARNFDLRLPPRVADLVRSFDVRSYLP